MKTGKGLQEWTAEDPARMRARLLDVLKPAPNEGSP